MITTTTNRTVFMNAVNSVQLSFTPSCPKLINAAIQQALAQAFPYGIVYVFTDSSFGDTSATGSTYTALENTKASVSPLSERASNTAYGKLITFQLSFILTNPNPCGQNFNSSSTWPFVTLARFSDGQLFAVTKTAVTPVRLLLTQQNPMFSPISCVSQNRLQLQRGLV